MSNGPETAVVFATPNESPISEPPIGAPSVRETNQRIPGIDTARGVALLGIFFVNAELFGQPLFLIMDPSAPWHESLFGQLAYWFTTIFCAGKFYPLFSILFGTGLSIMVQSTVRSNLDFSWIFLRRLIALGIFGVAHVLLLWSGDILLIYALIGLCMLLLGPCSPKTLLIVGGVVYAIGFGIISLIGLLWILGLVMADQVPKNDQPPSVPGIIAPNDPTSASAESLDETVSEEVGSTDGADGSMEEVEDLTHEEISPPDAGSPLAGYVQVFQESETSEEITSGIAAVDVKIMTQGPFWAAAVVRGVYYLIQLTNTILMVSWIILACFCLGAALEKLGFFRGQLPVWRRRFILLGLLVGLPLNVLMAVALQYSDHPIGVVGKLSGIVLAGPLLTLAYLSLILNWAESGKFAWLARVFGRAGKMALTCYLLESLLMSAIVLHWGFARFGDNTWAERTIWVLGIYFVILIFANLWMHYFRMGPLEWIWRAITYLRIPKAS